MSADSLDVPRLPPSGLSLLGDQDCAQGEDHYIETAFRMLADPTSQPPLPELVTSTAVGMLYFDLSRAGLRKTYERYLDALAQIANSAYLLVAAETWTLDTQRMHSLITDALTEWSAELERIEGQPLDFDSWDERTAETVRGMNSNVAEFRPLRDYLTSQPAYDRVESMRDTVCDAIAIQTKVKRRHQADFEPAAGCAWVIGRGLGILDLLGDIPRDPGAAALNSAARSHKPTRARAEGEPSPAWTQAEEKTCPDCAESVKAAARVCRFCRHEFPQCPECGEFLENESRCGHCGYDLTGQTMFCGDCEAIVPASATTCSECGATLDGDE